MKESLEKLASVYSTLRTENKLTVDRALHCLHADLGEVHTYITDRAALKDLGVKLSEDETADTFLSVIVDAIGAYIVAGGEVDVLEEYIKTQINFLAKSVEVLKNLCDLST